MRKPNNVWIDAQVIGGWAERSLTDKERAAIEESWRLANAGRQPQPAYQPVQSDAARSRQEGGDHYKRMGVEPWDVIDTWSLEQRIGFFRGNALKYLMRMGSKDEQATEVRKARHYIDKLIETLESIGDRGDGKE